VDAALVRAYLDSLADLPPGERSVERVRTCLASLQNPDVRYLVATVIGPAAPGVARVAAAVLRSAGARTATLGATLDRTLVDRDAMDDALLAKAGTMAAASGYQLAASAPELGELTRREGRVILALTAFAESSQRVALLLDPASDRHDPIHAPRPDLVVIASRGWAEVERALDHLGASQPTPVVVATPEERAREVVLSRVTELGVPALIGGRDYSIREQGSEVEMLVRDETYVRFEPPALVDHDELATGIATALALGALGIRMREEWILAGMDELRGAPVHS
jgi:folylpolyglutamate synthase/dihydropteroate synthase